MKKHFSLFMDLFFRCSTVLFLFLMVSNVSTAYSNDKVTLQLRWDHQFQFAGYYAAKWQGFYDDAGLDVEIKSGVNKEGILSAVDEVKSGRAHFGIGAADILMARDGGAPLVLVASIFQHSAAGFYTRKDTKITSPVDFLNLKVARRVNDLIDIELQALLVAEGLDPTLVKAYPHQAGMDHLISGEIDVMPGYTISTMITAKDKKTEISELRPISYGVDFYGDSIFTSETMALENPELVERFKDASLKGWQYALTNPYEIVTKISTDLPRIKRVADLYEFNMHQYNSMLKIIGFPDMELGHVNVSRWQRMHFYLSELGLLSNTFDRRKFIFDPEALEKASIERRQNILLWVLLCALGSFLLLVIWSFSLKRTVSKRTSELIKSNNKLQESERAYRDLIDTSPDIRYRCNMAGELVFASKSITPLTGFTETEAIGLNLAEEIYANGEERERFNQLIMEDGLVSDFEVQLKRKDGSLWWASTNAYLTLDDNGKPVGVEGVTRDITERKEAEINLKKSESQFRQIVQKSPLPMVIIDKKGEILLLNEKFTELFGYSIQDFSTVEGWWKAFTPDERKREEARRIWREALEKARSDKTEVDMMSWDVISLSGEQKVSEVYYAELESISLITLNDITERIKSETEKLNLESRLQHAQKMESIGTLAGGIAHDFNNILSSIMGFTELALNATDPKSQVHEDLQDIYTGGKRAKELVDQILMFARQNETELRPVNISILAKEVAKLLRSSIPATIKITTDIQGDDCVLGNITEIHQIIMNICTNAAHSMKDDGGTMTLTLLKVSDEEKAKDLGLVKHDDGYIAIKVQDTGEGISYQQMGRLFDPYFTTKEVGEGTGMGLAVVHGIVERYEGKITVESEVGAGSIFTVYLPIVVDTILEDEPDNFELLGGTESILFVDDESYIVKIGDRTLSQLGYKVVGVNDSVEALEIFKKDPKQFDLVITDMTMPGMTGSVLADEIFKIREDVPVIFCTGFIETSREEALKQGNIKTIMNKPLNSSDLAQVVRETLDGNMVHEA